jgi:hypothetical protein
MAKNLLVMFPLDAGNRLLDILDTNGFEVVAAFWLYQPELDEWQYYAATPLVETEGPLKLYQRIQSLLANAQPPLDIALGDVTLVNPNSNLVRSLRRIVKIMPGEQGMLLRRNTADIGGAGVEEAYIYRMLSPDSSTTWQPSTSSATVS